jgi:hypothetical protein
MKGLAKRSLQPLPFEKGKPDESPGRKATGLRVRSTPPTHASRVAKGGKQGLRRPANFQRGSPKDLLFIGGPACRNAGWASPLFELAKAGGLGHFNLHAILGERDFS